MNVGKLKRVAVKEFTRSPAKTGILLTLIPVALYFCVPLLFGALKKESRSTNAMAPGKVSGDASFVLPLPVKEVTTQSRSRQEWVEVARTLDEDLLALPAGIPSNARNPFAAIVNVQKTERLAAIENDGQVNLPETKEELEDFVKRTVVASNTIRELGLQLNATMVGRRARLATINGRAYEEGETIPVTIAGVPADSVATLHLKLAQVAQRFVVLEIDGHQHRLQLQQEIPKDAIVVKSRVE